MLRAKTPGSEFRWPGRVLRISDGSCVSKPGSKGTDWRVHAVYDLGAGEFQPFRSDGQAWRRSARPRAPPSPAKYGSATAIIRRPRLTPLVASVAEAGTADYVVRLRWSSLRLRGADGKSSILSSIGRPALRGHDTHCILSRPGCVRLPASPFLSCPAYVSRRAGRSIGRNSCHVPVLPLHFTSAGNFAGGTPVLAGRVLAIARSAPQDSRKDFIRLRNCVVATTGGPSRSAEACGLPDINEFIGLTDHVHLFHEMQGRALGLAKVQSPVSRVLPPVISLLCPYSLPVISLLWSCSAGAAIFAQHLVILTDFPRKPVRRPSIPACFSPLAGGQNQGLQGLRRDGGDSLARMG